LIAIGRLGPADLEVEHEIYADNVICEYPSGEKIHRRRNLQALRGHHPGRTSD
jgi:hypothetical protein